jgi:hypothetical protein
MLQSLALDQEIFQHVNTGQPLRSRKRTRTNRQGERVSLKQQLPLLLHLSQGFVRHPTLHGAVEYPRELNRCSMPLLSLVSS